MYKNKYLKESIKAQFKLDESKVLHNFIFLNWSIPCLFFFNFVLSIHILIQLKVLPMTGFEPKISGVERQRFNNWATTTTRFDLFKFHKNFHYWCDFNSLENNYVQDTLSL